MDLEDLFDGNRGGDRRGFRDQQDRDGRARGRYRDPEDEDRPVERQSRMRDDRQAGRDQYDDNSPRRNDSDRRRQLDDEDDDEDGPFDIEQLAQRLLANKKLLMIAGAILVAVVVVVLVFFQPLLGQAVAYLEKSGLKGVVDGVQKATGAGK
jgi:hypothetical protein